MRYVDLCKSHDLERVDDAGGVLNTGTKENGGERGKKGYIYSSSCKFLVHLVLLVTEHNRPNLHFLQPPGTSLQRSFETRFCTRSEETLHCPALLVHHTPLLPLRPRASPCKLSCSQVVPTVQLCNIATNTPSGGSCIHN